jgi:hypothetical protein
LLDVLSIGGFKVLGSGFKGSILWFQVSYVKILDSGGWILDPDLLIARIQDREPRIQDQRDRMLDAG